MTHKSNIFLLSFGSEGKEEGQFKQPTSLTCDHDGNIVVCDTMNHNIQVFKCEPKVHIGLQSKFDTKGVFLYSFGNIGREEGQFFFPKGVTCDHDGNIVVCDTDNHRIQVFKCEPKAHIDLQSKLTSKGEFLFSFGEFGEEEGQFCYPKGVACNHEGNIIVCDTENMCIKVFSHKGVFLYSFGSGGIEEEGQFWYPRGVICNHEDNIVVCDLGNHRIQVFDPKGEFLFSFGSKGEEEGQFIYPQGVTCDHDGNIVVCDLNHRIQVFDPKGKFIRSFGSKGKEEGQFWSPSGVTCDHDGNIVVSDLGNHRIQVFKGPSEVPTLLSLCWKHVDNLL